MKQSLFLLCETPLHAGSGSDLGLIDLPIQRERHTGFPKVEGSSLKGALREAFEKSKKGDNANRKHEETIHRIFGFDKDNAHESLKNGEKAFFLKKEDQEFKGCLTVTDCRLLLMPVKSQKGVCAWVTCPRVVSKFVNEMAQIGQTLSFNNVPFSGVSANTASSNAILIGGKVGIEEFIYDNVTVQPNTTAFAKHVATQFFADVNSEMHKLLSSNVLVLSDDYFAQLTELCTEVITRTKINNETGTVAQGALFNEEYLPQESVLYSLVFFENEFRKDTPLQKALKENDVQVFFNKHLPDFFQLGGNATIGKGIMRTAPKPATANPQNAKA